MICTRACQPEYFPGDRGGKDHLFFPSSSSSSPFGGIKTKTAKPGCYQKDFAEHVDRFKCAPASLFILTEAYSYIELKHFGNCTLHTSQSWIATCAMGKAMQLLAKEFRANPYTECQKCSPYGQSKDAKYQLSTLPTKSRHLLQSCLFEFSNPSRIYKVKILGLVTATVQGNLCLSSTSLNPYDLVGASSGQRVQIL